MSEDLPPSYSPGRRTRRPDPRGARPVGQGNQDPAPTRRMPQQRPTGRSRQTPPPSYAPPQRRPERPAQQQPAHEPDRGFQAPPPPRQKRRRRPGRKILVVLLVLLVAWPIGLLLWANTRLERTEALSGSADTPGTTYLLAGSDARGEAWEDGVSGQRTDTIMVLHDPASGPSALVSLPRDTLVSIPGVGWHKLNAAYSLGGPQTLVATVEQLTGLGVDHYVEIGMDGVQDVVDAVGGVELCLDYDVDDRRSGLQWTAGCHEADGATALAFARMRYADPEGDIGRTERQRQVVGAVMREVATPATVANPLTQVDLLRSGTGALVVDESSNILDLGRMALAFRQTAGDDGLVGTPPIGNFDYRPGGIGSTVLLDEQQAPVFFQRLRDGELTQDDFQQS